MRWEQPLSREAGGEGLVHGMVLGDQPSLGRLGTQVKGQHLENSPTRVCTPVPSYLHWVI